MDLHAFTTAPEPALLPTLLACADVPSWARALTAGRPWGDVPALLAAADDAARSWTGPDVDRALAAHPRIGEPAHRGGPEAGWSAAEQSGVADDAGTREQLTAGNHAYEERFGRVLAG